MYDTKRKSYFRGGMNVSCLDSFFSSTKSEKKEEITSSFSFTRRTASSSVFLYCACVSVCRIMWTNCIHFEYLGQLFQSAGECWILSFPVAVLILSYARKRENKAEQIDDSVSNLQKYDYWIIELWMEAASTEVRCFSVISNNNSI